MKASDATSTAKAQRDADATRPGASRGATSEDSCFSPAERFALTGPSIALDPRIHAYRSDIADIALAGQLIASHYARPVTRFVTGDSTALLPEPDSGAEPITAMARGEEFALLDITGRWAWGYRRLDHLVGYVEAERLSGAE